jgi:hypothetical protein
MCQDRKYLTFAKAGSRRAGPIDLGVLQFSVNNFVI